MRGFAGAKHARNRGELQGEIDPAVRRDGGAMTNAPGKSRGRTRAAPRVARNLYAAEYIGVRAMGSFGA